MIRFGEYGEHFFIIVAGYVSVSIPNPIIREWKDHYRRFKSLKEWKNTVFKARRKEVTEIMFGRDQVLDEEYEEKDFTA